MVLCQVFISALFIDASDTRSEIDRFTKKKGGDENLTQDHLKKLHELKEETWTRWERVLREVAELDREWLTDSGDNRKTKVRRLTILSHELSYLSKLQSLIDELIIAIS